MKAVVKLTGEVIELNPVTDADVYEAWRTCSEYIKAYTELKDKLKPFVERLVTERGTSEPLDGYMFRQSFVQRMNYDKTVLRQVIRDEDTFDMLLAVDKKAVDDYLKEHLEEVGQDSTLLRDSMVPVGKPYTVLKLEKL